MQDTKQLLTRRQVCDWLNIKYHTLLAYEQRGNLTPIRLGGRTIRYTPEQIESFIQASKRVK